MFSCTVIYFEIKIAFKYGAILKEIRPLSGTFISMILKIPEQRFSTGVPQENVSYITTFFRKTLIL